MSNKIKKKAWVVVTSAGNAEVFYFSKKVTEKQAKEIVIGGNT